VGLTGDGCGGFAHPNAAGNSGDEVGRHGELKIDELRISFERGGG